MKFGRRSIVLLSGLVLAAAVAVALAWAFGRDGDDLPRFPGRIAVRAGCGLTHMYSDGTDRRQMCLPELWAAVSVSKNGERLAWDTTAGIYTATADGVNPVLSPLPPGANFDPSLAPDGEELAFLHSPRDDGRYDIWVGSTSANDAEQLTNTRDVSTLDWSPTGDWIAFVRGWSEATLEGDIVLIRPSGDDETLLTRGDSPTWAPDGSALAFARSGSIWTIDADGSDPRLLVRNGESPAWSRDGKLIAFMRELSCGKPVCKQRVFVIGATGGPARPVGPEFEAPRSPLWLPDPFE
jgi:dipeptidyl aminopeptidase/acylaminoacyl peptidase